ncbi:hypothetical protein RvY_02875-2 [Ramazzottius varieornatus]|uniref:Uncharacterized protein n=1 Tax=Ramazzottius varieornatus TaxID=947166 RepID=A0A1D1UPZ8_RAMVA|nr:hypothetical protein RvY_02875-2 [Ramazzottius varieornatus]
MSSWKNGEELFWDFTVVDTLAITNFAMSTLKPDPRCRRKEKDFQVQGHQKPVPVLPRWFRDPWTIRPCAKELFEAVGRKMAEVTGESDLFTPSSNECQSIFCAMIIVLFLILSKIRKASTKLFMF